VKEKIMKYYKIKYDKNQDMLILTLERQYGVSWNNILSGLKKDFFQMTEELEYDQITGNWSCEANEDTINYFIKQGWKCPAYLLKKFCIDKGNI
jgi:hypothetical protein